MGKRFGILLTVFIFASAVSGATPQQTVQDSMDGDRCVINGDKRFMSGMNIAWVSSTSFGNDVGDNKIDINSFTTYVKQIRRAGGNSLRWWLHTDASHCPKIDSTGAVTGLGSETISNITEALDTAYAYGVVVSLCLFSFDMLVLGDGDGKASYSDYDLQSNYLFLTEANNIDTYLENGLGPILDSVGSHPAIMCWEVFNEPEGMLESAGWSHVEEKISQDDILRITNKIAGYVHRNSKKMVSTGIASTDYVDEYSDDQLVAAGGDNDGYLDFYMVHYYPEWQGESMSPFHNPASNWNMDRPVLIGEFPAKSWDTSMIGESSGQSLKTSKDIVEAYDYAYQNGYAGAMSWCMSGTDSSSFLGSYSTTKPALEALYDAHTEDIMIKDVTIEEVSGNYVMKLALEGVPDPDNDGEYNELGTSMNKDLSDYSTISFDLYVEPNSGTNLQIVPVIKVTDAYTWSPAQDEAVLLSSVEQGEWVTVDIPVSAFGAEDLSDVREILFQYWAMDESYTGTVYFDNVLADNDTLYKFNSEGSAWSTVAAGSSVGLVKYSDLETGVFSSRVSPVKNSNRPVITSSGKTVLLDLDHTSDVQFSIVDLKGKTVKRFKCGNLNSGIHEYSLKGISAGSYIVRLRRDREIVSVPIMLK